MSSLIFYTDEVQALVATDTLAVNTDGAPFMFTSKAFAVPHLRTLIAGTGAGGFIGRWFIEANDRLVVRGIDHLDYHAPDVLARLWEGYRAEYSIPSSITTTVYHFGFSEVESCLHTYVYRSANAFRSETLPRGTAVKPECEIPENPTYPADVRAMMEQQRSIQAALPPDERVYIGGEILIHHITRAGISIWTAGRFDDYVETETAIYRNFIK